MASFEPIVLVFGSTRSIAAARLQLPVPFVFAFDTDSLEEQVNVAAELTDISLPRYFVVLLDAVEEDLFVRLKANHRVIAVYTPERMCANNQEQANRMTHSIRQLTLDVTSDIVCFLTMEGQKQLTLERTSLVKVYYQQARVLKEWAMSSIKAEPCHILLISLNSHQEKLDRTQQRLQDICTTLGYPLTVIRQLQNYLPKNDQHLSLLPYAKLMFENEKPRFMGNLIRKLSPIRLYIYGNQLCQINSWSRVMIEGEKEVMDDEDNWCAFLESEPIDNAVKWNFAYLLGKEWQVHRVSPMDWDQLDDHPQLYSALRRAQTTFAERQMEVTAEVFSWYSECLDKGFLHTEPKLTHQQALVKQRHRPKTAEELSENCRFRHLRSLNYSRLNDFREKSVAFIWLDEILSDCEDRLHRIIEPFHWRFFDSVASCVPFIESQLREQRYVFLVASGTLGHELFLTPLSLMVQIFSAYIYCAHLGPHLQWSQDYARIRGVFNDPNLLANQIQQDYDPLRVLLNIDRTTVTTSHRMFELEPPGSLPLIVLNPENVLAFIGHQRTIDNLLCMPHTDDSKAEMIAELRRIFEGDPTALGEIGNFEETYRSYAAVQWYTRDSFVWRTLNQVLRSSDVEAMFKLRYILTDIYAHLSQTHEQRRRQFRPNTKEMHYRGQVMFRKEFDAVGELRGSIISINTFLSTTSSMQIAMMYAGQYLENADLVSVVFSIETNPQQQTRPYANISQFSMFPDEDEVLFAMGSAFRVGSVRLLPDSENIWLIKLHAVDEIDYVFDQIPPITTASLSPIN